MSKSLAIELKRLNNALTRFSSKEAKKFGITAAQMSLIDFLYRTEGEEPIFQTDIEKEFNIQKSSATALLKLMEKKELIVRVVSQTDSRYKQIMLTPRARKSGEKIRAVYKENDAHLKDVLGNDADSMLNNVLKLQAALEKLNE